MDYTPIIQSAGQQYNVDPSLISAVLKTESNFNPNAVGPDTKYGNAIGIAQILPSTAKQLGIDPSDPTQAISGAAKLLSDGLDRYGNVADAVASYHGGTDTSNWGPNTATYASKVLSQYALNVSSAKQQGAAGEQGLPPFGGGNNGTPMVDPFAGTNVPPSAASSVQSQGPQSQGYVDPFSTVAPSSSPPPSSSGESLGAEYSDYLSAFGHNLAKIPLTIGQGELHAAHWLASKLPDNPVSRAIANQTTATDQALQNNEAAYQASTPNSVGGIAGAIVGNVLPFAIAAPESVAATGMKFLPDVLGPAGGAVGDAAANIAGRVLPSRIASGIGTVANSATQGALAAAVTQPVTNGGSNYVGDKLDQIESGALVGGAIPIAIRVAGGIKNAGAALIKPFTNPGELANATIEGALGDKAATVADLTPDDMELVPGSKPTLDQVAPTPAMVQLRQALGNNPDAATAFLARDNANNAARLAYLDTVAKTDAELQAAKGVRTDADNSFWNAVGNPRVDVTNLDSLIDGMSKSGLGATDASVHGALLRAQKVLRDNSSPASAGELIGNALDPISSLLTNPPRMSGADFDALSAAKTKIISAQRGYTGIGDLSDALGGIQTTSKVATQALDQARGALQDTRQYANADIPDGIRKNLNDYLAKEDPNGIVGESQTAAIRPLKSAIINGLDIQVPNYRSYLVTHAQNSQPITDMEVAQELRKVLLLKNLNTAENPQVGYQNYQSTLARVLKKSDYPISPEAQSVLGAIQDDLHRATISYSPIAKPGSNTNYNGQAQSWLANKIYGDDYSGKTPIAKAVATALGGGIGFATGGLFGAATGSGAAYAGMGNLAKSAGAHVNAGLVNSILNPEVAAGAISSPSGASGNGLISHAINYLATNPMTANLMREAATSQSSPNPAP